MQNLFLEAEGEMKELKHPYVGSHHLFLAFLKNNNIDSIDYKSFKDCVINIIGTCYKESEYIIYTPLLREIKENEKLNNKEKIIDILNNSDSIVYNILLSKGFSIEDIYNEVKNTKLS